MKSFKIRLPETSQPFFALDDLADGRLINLSQDDWQISYGHPTILLAVLAAG